MVEVAESEASRKTDQAEFPLRILIVDDDKAVSSYCNSFL